MHRDPNLGAFFVTEKLLIKGIEKVLLRNSYSDQGKVRDRSVSWLIEKTSSLLIKAEGRDAQSREPDGIGNKDQRILSCIYRAVFHRFGVHCRDLGREN